MVVFQNLVDVSQDRRWDSGLWPHQWHTPGPTHVLPGFPLSRHLGILLLCIHLRTIQEMNFVTSAELYKDGPLHREYLCFVPTPLHELT